MEPKNIWRKRTAISFTCLSGNKITVRRPGPDLALKATRLPRILQRPSPAGITQDTMVDIIATLPDDELIKVMEFARVLIADVVVNPVLSLNPKGEQLSPDDLPLEDFWGLFDQATRGFPTAPVKLEEGETSIEAVQNFPLEQDEGDNAHEDSPAN